jgi:hypothetical protein
MTDKVIFLDVDGVLTSSRDNGFRDFNLHVVHWLRWLCEVSGAKIVLSSTWRHSHFKGFWETIFGEHVHEDWETPASRERFRGDEVNAWLAKHPEVTTIAILDDDADFHDDQKKSLILCDPHNGMLFDHIMELRDILKVDKFVPWDREVFIHPNMFGTTREKENFEPTKKPNFTN